MSGEDNKSPEGAENGLSWAESKTQKRRRIFEAAFKVFGQSGFERAKVEDIAKEAGIGKGTLYEYFASKQELFREMAFYLWEYYIEQGRAAALRHESFQDRILAILEYQAHTLRDNYGALSVLMSSQLWEDDEWSAKLWSYQAAYRNLLVQLVEEGVASGELRGDIDAAVAARLIVSISYASTGMIICSGEKDPMEGDDGRALLVDLLFHGLGAGAHGR